MTQKAETTKREVIRKAYGEHWNKVKNRLSSDFWFTPYHMENREWATFANNNDWDINGQSVRPKSLQGIENNNGWFSIEEHGLKEGEFEFLIHEDYRKKDSQDTQTLTVNKALIENKDMAWNVYSHYRPIEEVKLPLY